MRDLALTFRERTLAFGVAAPRVRDRNKEAFYARNLSETCIREAWFISSFAVEQEG